MTDSTGSILLRRGPTNDRLAFCPLDGEIIYDSELKQVFVGDGQTFGGNPVSLTRGGTVIEELLLIQDVDQNNVVGITSTVTTGIVNLFTNLTTGTINLATGGASFTNIGGPGSTLNIGTTSGNSTIEIRGNASAGIATLRTNANTASIFDSNSAIINAFGSSDTIRIGSQSGILTLRNPTVVGTEESVNLWNSVSTTVNFAGAATNVQIGSATGTTNINNNLDVDSNVNIDGGNLTASTSEFNLINTIATTVNFAGAATNVQIGSTTGTATIKNANVVLNGDLQVKGGDLTTNQTTFNLINTTATTVNFAGDATEINIGASSGTTNIGDNLDIAGDVNIASGALTTNQTTFNLINTTATTVNFAGDATEINIGSAGGSINTAGKLVISSSNKIEFPELEINGINSVGIKGPDSVLDSYTLTLPNTIGPEGSVLALGPNNNLEFVDADIFGGSAIYVSALNGDDSYNGVNKPVKTIKRALQLASSVVYDPVTHKPNGRKIAINVAAGEYQEDNPLIVPDNVSVIGASLRACNLRPLNANKDFLRVRNASYFSEFTFRDALSEEGKPVFTWNYAVSFDNPLDATTSRVGYTHLPDTKPVIDISPYIQNCSIISFLGGSGALVDGNLVITPNIPKNQIQVENPVSGPAPEQGHSMVANAFTMLTFGGTAWRVINDAYIQIVSCFQIFALNGTYCQSGGYASITNSATNFGIYALRASGYSPNAFQFDKGYVATTGINNSLQSITAIGFGRNPTQDYVVRFRDPSYKYAYDLLMANKLTIVSQTSTWIDSQIASNTPPFVGYNYTGTNRSKGERDTGLIIDAVASDILTGGNSNSVAAGLSFQELVSGIEDICITSATYTKTLIQAAVSTLSGKSALSGNYCDIIINAISTPGSAPEAFPYGTASDITSSFIPTSEAITFDAASVVNISTNIFTITDHGFSNGDPVIYDSELGTQISGLFDEQTYYIQYINANTFTLAFDDSLTKTVDILAAGTGTQSFVKNLQEFMVKDLVETHNRYQTLTLAAGTYTFTPGTTISGITGTATNQAYVYSYDGITRQLVVSLNNVIVSGSLIRNAFAAGSTITVNNGVGVSISVTDAANRSDLYSGTFTVISTTTGGLITNLSSLPTTQIWLHRPSIVNSSGHTWEYAGSGTDYNALPQNGGQTRFEYQQFSDLPGRVYSSGTNELGDFLVGDFIKAENRTGNVSFTNKVSVAQLDVLRLALGDIVIDYISDDIGLGDNEAGGASDSRLSTQKAIRSFLANRLGNFIDKSVSTNAVPGSVIQLNSSGQINADLLPAVRSFNSARANGYTSRLSLVEEVPATDLLNGDIVSEVYSSVQLTLSANITANPNDLVTQTSTGASGYLVSGVAGSNVVTVASYGNITGELFSASFTTGGANVLTIAGVVTSVYPTLVGSTATGNTANYVLVNSNESQYLILPTTGSYSFTSGNVVTAANDLVQGEITSTRYGVVNGINLATFTPGTGYTPATGTTTYKYVLLTSSSGSGARADITVTNGSVVNIDLRRGGTGYSVGDLLSASAASIGGTVTTPFSVPITAIENRLYVNLIGGTRFAGTQLNPNFIADNNATSSVITLTSSTQKSFNAADIGSGGDVNVLTSVITIASHGFSNGDPVTYSSGVNVPLGGLATNTVYYVKVLTSSSIALYNEYSLTNLMIILSSSSGTHTVTISTVNTISNTFSISAHGFTTGDCFQLTGSSPPQIDSATTASGRFFFVGSVTLNSFTLHTSRIDALSSINGLAILPLDISSTGSGSATLIKQNVPVYNVVNTSSVNINNWSPLSTTTVDASNIISGIISTSRLGTSSANDTTYLRGDQTWHTVAQSIKKASGSALSPTGSFYTSGSDNLYYGDITLDVDKTDGTAGDDNYTNLGVSKFFKTQFNVGTGGNAGQIYVKDGVIDAGTLQSYNAAYFLNPANLSSAVPVNKGGTNLSTYSIGDLIYASGEAVLNPLSIGDPYQVLTVNTSGTSPTWSSSLSLSGNLTVAGNLTVNGTTVTLNSSTLNVDDKNVTLGSVISISGLTSTLSAGNYSVTVSSTSGLIPGMTLTKTGGTGVFGASAVISTIDSSTQFSTDKLHSVSGPITFTVGGASDDTAESGGLSLKGTTDKTFLWSKTNAAWTSSEHIDLVSGKEYKINGTRVLSSSTLGSGITSSSLTSVGTIASGTWEATDVGILHGGTGASDAETARSNLGVAIGTNVQAWNSTLDSVSAGTYTGDDSISTVGTVTSGTWNASTISAARGGTGFNTYAKGDLVYASDINTLSKLGKPASVSVLQIDLAGNITWAELGATQISGVGTVTSGTWNASIIDPTYGGTGINNGTKTITLGGNILTSGAVSFNGAFSTTLTVSAATSVTLPTSGTLSTLSGIETLTNKTLIDANTVFQNNSVSTKQLKFQLSGVSPNTTVTLSVPDVSGTIVTTGDTGSITSTMIANGTIVNGDISTSAAIAISKLAASTISGISLGNNLNTLTLGNYLTGVSYNGSSAVTAAVDATTDATANKIVARDSNGRIMVATGSTGGISFPNDSYGGTGDTATITLDNASGGEATRLLVKVTNDANDTIEFSAPSNDGVLINGNKIWHAGNDGDASGLDADKLDGLHASSSHVAGTSTIVSRNSSGNISVEGITVTSITSGGTSTAGTLTGAWSLGSSSQLDCTAGTLKSTTLTTGAEATTGTITGYWSLVGNSRLNATYADLAEKYVADQQYEPGTVLMFGGAYEVTIAKVGTRRVAGIVSTNAAYIMNSDCCGEFVVELALQGRVPCKVRGKISKGDMLIADRDGYAISSEDPKIGQVIGKALEDFDQETGVIEVVVGRL